MKTMIKLSRRANIQLIPLGWTMIPIGGFWYERTVIR